MSTQHLLCPDSRRTPRPAPLLSLTLTCGPVTVIELCGELDMSTTHLITELITYVAKSSPSHVILDMTGVSFFCAAGLNALLQAQKTIKDSGGQFLLRNPSATTSSILTITGVADIFQISQRP